MYLETHYVFEMSDPIRNTKNDDGGDAGVHAKVYIMTIRPRVYMKTVDNDLYKKQACDVR